jgi:ATP-dependent DNA helicase RecG
MLLPKDIIELIKGGEGYNLEFKESLPKKLRELSMEICAFANAAGGVLLIGVNDENSIVGVEIDNHKRASIQNTLNEISPSLDCSVYDLTVQEKTLWVIEVQSGLQKPYTLSGSFYIRQGSITQKITSVDQMRDFFQQNNRIYFDEGVCSDFDVENDLDTEYFEEFRSTAGLSTAIHPDQIIQNLRLTSSNKIFKNGAVLFFAKSPESFFDKAVIRCIAFQGTTKVEILDDKVYGGPLMKQYAAALQWLKSKLDVRYIIEGSGPRVEVMEIPEIVFKEALINALAHRDYYDKGARITVELFKDRVEITNPGSLVSAISSEDFGFKSHSRNPLIFGLFERVHMVEQVGSGVPRIRKAMLESNLPAPEFRTEGLFTLILGREKLKKDGVKTRGKTRVKTRGKTRVEILGYIRTDSGITMPELAKRIGITEKGIEYHMNSFEKSEN